MRTDRRKRDGCMLCTPLDARGEAQLRKDNTFIVQPKLDGERCIAEVHNGRCLLYSSTRKPILTMPHITTILASMFPKEADVVFDGELYRHGITRQHLRSFIGTKDIHPDAAQVEYWIFDLLDEDMPQHERIKLAEMVPMRGPIKVCLSILITDNSMRRDPTDFMHYARAFAEKGFEGAIFRRLTGVYVKKRSRDIFKLKVMEKTWCTIIGWKEEVSKEGLYKGTLGALQCKTPDGVVFHVGTGPILTKENRQALWKYAASLMNKRCLVKHQFLSADGVPLCPSLYEIEGWFN